MIMIIGGAYQGKLAFAKKIYPDVTWADGAVCTEEELYTDEIGYGIVPVDRMEREYREQTGRVCTRLAAYSEKVYRVMCGIGQVIKEV